MMHAKGQASLGQSRRASLLEALAGVATGLVLSVWIQRVLFPAMGYDLALGQNVIVALVFTMRSVCRNYALRRLFNGLRDKLP